MCAIPLTGKALRRFYEPIVLGKALTDIHLSQIDQGNAYLETLDTVTSETDHFKSFLCRLSNVCDREKGGTTVTSFAVLEYSEGIMYVCGCNQVTEIARQEMVDFVTTLLDKLAGVSELDQPSRDKVHGEMHRLVLAWNRPRIELYFKVLCESAEMCLKACHGSADSQNANVASALSSLRDSLAKFDFSKGGDLDYLDSCIPALKAIKTSFTPRMGITQTINDRARKGRRMLGSPSLECWSELRHSLSRLHSYEKAVTELMDAAQEWPELFHEPDIVCVPSSHACRRPLGKRSESASSIIGRMTGDLDKKDRYQAIAEELQPLGLDDRIKDQYQRSGFKPYVHAEILVLEWVLAKLHTEPVSFFLGLRYISSSKPTCKLCSYYFDAHPSRIEARPSHGNLYPNWRFPDVVGANGSTGLEQRQEIMEYMVSRLRDDAFQLMDDKHAPWKRHDSNSYSLASARQTDLQTTSAIEELGDRFGTGMSLNEVDSSSPLSEEFVEVWRGEEQVGKGKKPEVVSDDEDDEDEEGGAKLS